MREILEIEHPALMALHMDSPESYERIADTNKKYNPEKDDKIMLIMAFLIIILGLIMIILLIIAFLKKGGLI